MQFKDIFGHKKTIKRLIDVAAKNRVSHAQLFYGAEGTGKISLTIAYAQYLNCTNPQNGDSCGECKSCKKFAHLAHPDLHFIYPVVKTPKISKPVSLDYLDKWRDFIKKSKFHSYNEWLEFIGTDNLQGSIYSQESKEIIRIINLKTFEAKYKSIIIYMPEKMNISAANKLLKAIEEPPPDTLFFLISEDESSILSTIRSRTQLIKISKLSNEELEMALRKEISEFDEKLLKDTIKISAGNFIYARQILNKSENYFQNFNLFTELMRTSFSANFASINNIAETISKLGREKQKSFLAYSLRLIRENFILNTTKNNDLNYLTQKEAEFSKKFNRFINKKNIEQLFYEFNKAYSDIARNASAKILFFDLMLKTSQLLRTK